MFTGLISDIGTIAASENGGRKITIRCHYPWRSLRPGESIAVNGACLTVVARGSHKKRWLANSNDSWFAAELSDETLSRTAPRWQQDARVNLERALIAGDPLDGHLVTGHVDGTAVIKTITPVGNSQLLEIEAPASLARFIAEKGSVALDGISLTVNKVEDNRFWVNIIPHTLQNTTLSLRKPGDSLNIEIDLMARYAARLLEK